MFKRWVYLSPYSGRRSQKKSDKMPRPRLSPVPLTQARTKKREFFFQQLYEQFIQCKSISPLASAGSFNCAIHHFLTLCWNQMTCGGWHELLMCDTEGTLSAPCTYKQIFKAYKRSGKAYWLWVLRWRHFLFFKSELSNATHVYLPGVGEAGPACLPAQPLAIKKCQSVPNAVCDDTIPPCKTVLMSQ